MMRRIVVAAVLAASTASAAGPVPPRPADFAWQLPLTVSGDNGVVQFRLPAEVYLRARHAQLGDLRVFDPAGQPVPFALHQPRPAAVPATREQAVPQFPIHAAAGDADRALALNVRASSDGSLLAIEARSAAAATDDAPLTAVIVDIGAAAEGETLEQVRFELPDGTTAYHAVVRIEQSDDLKLWEALAQSTLDWIASAAGDAHLVNDRIALSGTHGRYLRITWRDGAPIEFGRIVARWRSASATTDTRLQVVLEPQPGRQPGDWIYPAAPAIAATQLVLELAQPNTVLPVGIGTYRAQPRLQPAWRFDADVDATFHRLTRDGVEHRSGPIATAPIAHAEWVVRSQRADEAAPKLVLRWQPDTLVFNARGTGPFTLAFGAAPERVRTWTPGATTLALVAPGYAPRELAELEVARAGDIVATPIDAADAPRDAATRSTTAPRTLALWSVLALGVLVLAAMSWRLFKQLAADKGEAQ